MKVKKRALSCFLAGVMTFNVMLLSGVVTNAEDAGVKKIELGTSGVADKDFVYFGNYNSADIKWKVLDADADNTGAAQGMFLLSEYLLEQGNAPFEAAWDSDDGDGQVESNEWQHSDAQGWCTAFADSSAFTASEKTGLKSVSKIDSEVGQYGITWSPSSLINEKVFYLSAEEAATYISPVGNVPALVATTIGGDAGNWWMRSPAFVLNGDIKYVYAGIFYNNGVTDGVYSNRDDMGVRPAFNLNLNTVLFSSAAEGGKSSGTVGANALNLVSEHTTPSTTRAWKVTLADSSRQNFTAQAVAGATTKVVTGYSDWSVDVIYDNATTGANEYVSALLCDESGNVLYYGNIAQGTESGTQTVNIPAGLAIGKYTLKVISEQLNGDNKTDYASAFKDIELEVTLTKADTPNAKFNATSENSGTLKDVTTNMQYSVDGGTIWNDVTNTTMDIIGVTALNGVQIQNKGDGVSTSNSDAQTITITQVAKPMGLTKTDCSTNENNNGIISGVDHTM